VDDTVNRTLHALDERGLRENTVIIFTSDHGPVWPRGKQMTYTLSLDVPLIVVAPEAEPGSRRTELVSLVDIMPTVVQLAGGDVPDLRSDARSLIRTLDHQVPPRKVLGGEFFQHWGPAGFFPSYALRNERYSLNYSPYGKWGRTWKEYRGIPFLEALPNVTDEAYAQAFKRSVHPPQYELYDLQDDPWEYYNLAEDPRYREELDGLKLALKSWREENADPFLDQSVMDKAIALHRKTARAISGKTAEEERANLEAMSVELGAIMRGE
jgi:N-sulfoglucosamine sulfohydrolase